MFAEPIGLFSGLVLDACAVCVPALSSLSLLGEQHSLAQWPCLPQLWHLPLRRHRFPSSGAVAAKASCHGSTGPWVWVSMFQGLLQRSQGDQLLVDVQALNVDCALSFKGRKGDK